MLIAVAILAPLLAGIRVVLQVGDAIHAFYFPKDRPIRVVPAPGTPPGATTP